MSLTVAAPQARPMARRMRWSSDDLLAEVQATLRALANVELRYEAAREQLERRAGPDIAKHGRFAELEARYRQEREPYLYRLDQLQQRIRRVALSGL